MTIGGDSTVGRRPRPAASRCRPEAPTGCRTHSSPRRASRGPRPAGIVGCPCWSSTREAGLAARSRSVQRRNIGEAAGGPPLRMAFQARPVVVRRQRVDRDRGEQPGGPGFAASRPDHRRVPVLRRFAGARFSAPAVHYVRVLAGMAVGADAVEQDAPPRKSSIGISASTGTPGVVEAHVARYTPWQMMPSAQMFVAVDARQRHAQALRAVAVEAVELRGVAGADEVGREVALVSIRWCPSPAARGRRPRGTPHVLASAGGRGLAIMPLRRPKSRMSLGRMLRVAQRGSARPSRPLYQAIRMVRFLA